MPSKVVLPFAEPALTPVMAQVVSAFGPTIVSPPSPPWMATGTESPSPSLKMSLPASPLRMIDCTPLVSSLSAWTTPLIVRSMFSPVLLEVPANATSIVSAADVPVTVSSPAASSVASSNSRGSRGSRAKPLRRLSARRNRDRCASVRC